MQPRNRKRLQLVLLASLFVAPMAVAALLALTGWVPGTRSFGEGIVPQRTVENVRVELADGQPLQWRDPDWRWSVVALPGRSCGDACVRQLDRIHRARISLNQKAQRVRLIYLGAPPHAEGAAEVMQAWTVGRDVDRGFADWMPNADDEVVVVLVKPDGTALTVYREGFDASGLRKDLAKVTK